MPETSDTAAPNGSPGPRAEQQPVRLTSRSPGAGCACKLPLASLERLMAGLGDLGNLGSPSNPGTLDGHSDVGGRGAATGGTVHTDGADKNVLIGLAEGDDAAVLRLDHERALIVTTDFFTPIVDSPYDWGRIAAANALSDVYAMGGRPLLALNLAGWPEGDLPVEMLGEVLRGGAAVAGSAGCAVVGGHTIDDAVPKYGMAVVGMAHPELLFAIDRAAVGDELVLTKPLGTGVVATAIKHASPAPAVVRAAVDSMTSLNAPASEAAHTAGVRAATDVTGFGLLGHLHRMLRASGLSAEVDGWRVPFLPGAPELVADGFVSGGTRSNTAFLADAVRIEPGVPEEVAVLLHDAQTSGGLLLAANPAATPELVRDLRDRGLQAASVGRVVAGQPGEIGVRAQPR